MTVKNWFRTYQDILAESNDAFVEPVMESEQIEECACEDKMNEEVVEEDSDILTAPFAGHEDLEDDGGLNDVAHAIKHGTEDEFYANRAAAHAEMNHDDGPMVHDMSYGELLNTGWKDIGLHFSHAEDADLHKIAHRMGLNADELMAVKMDDHWRVLESPSELDEAEDSNAEPALEINHGYRISAHATDSDIKGKQVIYLGMEERGPDDWHLGTPRARVALVNHDGSRGGEWRVKPSIIVPL